MNLIAGKTVSIDFESRDKDVLVVPSSITETVVVVSGIDTAIPVAATPSIAGVTFLAFEVPADSEAGTKFFVRMTAIVGGVELSTTKPVGIVGVDIEARMDAQDACLAQIKSAAQARTTVSPAASSNQKSNAIELIRGNDYTGLRAIQFEFPTTLAMEDLTGTAKWVWVDPYCNEVVGEEQTTEFEIVQAGTAVAVFNLQAFASGNRPGDYQYETTLCLDNQDAQTIACGCLTIKSASSL